MLTTLHAAPARGGDHRSLLPGRKEHRYADVLAGIAADYGFEHAEAHAIALDPVQHKRVEQEPVRSAEAGVRSVPHFIFGGRAAINGGRSEDEIAPPIQEAARSGEPASMGDSPCDR